VETLSAFLWLAMPFARPGGMGPEPDPLLLLVMGWLLASWLLPLTLVDIDRLWLPEPLCRWGLVCGLLLTTLVGLRQDPATARQLLLQHLAAASLGLLALELVGALAQRCLGRPALGLGDAKLAAMIGAWLGLTGLGLAVALAVAAGAVVGLLARLVGLLGPRQPFPFGPFLALGCLTVWISGPGIWIGLFFPGL
jgi:leader peptidase (prepilin peptidase)/N-methyltransferase